MEQINQPERQWTREHDAVIAEKVEGLQITTEHFSAGVEGRTTAWNRYFYNDPDWGMIEIPSYNQPKHFFRALEKWRERGARRKWEIKSTCARGFFEDDEPASCSLLDYIKNSLIIEYGKDAPSWALYKAVVDEV